VIKATEGEEEDHSTAVTMAHHLGDTMMVVTMVTTLVHPEEDVVEEEAGEAVEASDEAVVKTKMMAHPLKVIVATTL
jgi:hypothetical protein